MQKRQKKFRQKLLSTTAPITNHTNDESCKSGSSTSSLIEAADQIAPRVDSAGAENTDQRPPIRWLRPDQAAAYLGLAVSTLAKMRVIGDGPRYTKLTDRSVAYDIDDLDAYANARKRLHTSEIGGQQ